MARKRSLSEEERSLWQAVAKTARPIRGVTAADLQEPLLAGADAKPLPPLRLPEVAQPVFSGFRLGEKALPAPKVSVSAAPAEALRMDARTHHRLVRGKMMPEARIDLHGMTLAEAHPELIAFVLGSFARGLRLVLVITGKGKKVFEPVPRPMGALRHQVPHWLRLAPLAPVVQQVTEAHLKHGGSGAFYVWLRRRG